MYPSSFCEYHEVPEKYTGTGNIQGKSYNTLYLIIKGIIRKLDTLRNDLGVDAIWVCPIFDSPMRDHGYDVRDYRKINPHYGTMRDFLDLIQKTHEHVLVFVFPINILSLGMKLILDFVPNHTSNEHQWFQDSRHCRNGRDEWYIWSKGFGDARSVKASVFLSFVDLTIGFLSMEGQHGLLMK